MDAMTLVEGVAGGLAVALPVVLQALRDQGQEPLADAVARALGPSAVDAAAADADRKAAEAFGVAPPASGRTLPLPGVPAPPAREGGGG